MFGNGRGTIIKSQLGLISEQECVEIMTEELSPGHAIPCGSLIRVMGEAIGGAETEHTRKIAEERQKSWDRIDRAIAKERGY